MDIPEEDLGEAGSKAARSNTTKGRPGRYLKKTILQGEPKQVEEGHDIPDDEDETESQQLQLVVTQG